MRSEASGGIGKPSLVTRVTHHAHPVVPQPHTYGALMTYIRYHFGFVLPTMYSQDDMDRYSGHLLGSVVAEREARLRRIGAVYPEAEAEARRHG